MTTTATVRATTTSGQTFYIEMVPQREGAMGARIECAYEARIRLASKSNGGIGPRAALAMLARQAKDLSTATLNADDLAALEAANKNQKSTPKE